MRRKSLLELDQESTDAAPAWAVSFGDMMSLLLAHFVMLLSMSEINQNDRFQGVADSLHEQFRLSRVAESVMGGNMKSRSAPLAVLAISGQEARRRVMQAASPQMASNDTQSKAAECSIMFAPRSSEITAEAIERLTDLARSLTGTSHRVEIRGFMESLHELDLAWQRARAVAQLLIERAEIEPSRLRISVLSTAGAIDTSGPGRPPEKPMVEVILQGEPPAQLAARPTAARSGNAP